MCSTVEYMRQCIVNNAILSGKQQRLVSPSGNPNAWLIDLRRLLSKPQFLDAFAEAFWQRFESRLPFQIGGMEVASVPLITAILMKSLQKGHPVNGFIIRKERKTYGAGNIIEGLMTDEPIIIIDDIFNSGDSAEKIYSVIYNEGRIFSELFVIIDYKSDSGLRWSDSRDVAVDSLFDLRDFGLPASRIKSGVRKQIFEITWSFKSPDPNFHELVPKSFPITDDRLVYFGSDAGLFRALDAQTGKVSWDFKVSTSHHKNIWSSPALHDHRVYFGAYDGNVYCLDALTGVEIWRNTGAEWVGSSPSLAPELNLIFIGLEFAIEGRRGAVSALDMNTGEMKWSHATKRYTHASPVYSKEFGVVACGSNDDELLLFNALTGEKLWRFQTRGDGSRGSIRHAPAFYERGRQVVTGCADGYIYIVDLSTGQEVWSFKTGNTIYTVPLIVDDKAYVGSTDKSLYVLDLKTGVVDTKMMCSAKIFSPPGFDRRASIFWLYRWINLSNRSGVTIVNWHGKATRCLDEQNSLFFNS